MTTLIRPGGINDIPAVARVHACAWRQTYRGMIPDGVLDSLEHAGHGRVWSDCITYDDHGLLVAEADGEVVGFSAFGPPRDPLIGADGEIYAICLLKRWQCRGIGSRLMGATASELVASGVKSVAGWVARDDVAALTFLRALGATFGMARIGSMPGRTFIEMALVWDRAADLILFDDRPRPEEFVPRMRAAGGGQSPAAAGTTASPDACRPA